MSLVNVAALVFAALGGAFFALCRALAPPSVDLALTVARYDAAQRERTRRPEIGDAEAKGAPTWIANWQRRLGRSLARELETRGVPLGHRRADLELLGWDRHTFLGRKVLVALYGALLLPIAVAVVALAGVSLPASVAAGLPIASAALAVAFFLLPDLELRRQAGSRRRDFTCALGAFLDLVSMSLAGGRGVPEALPAAARISEGWAFTMLADTIADARLAGRTPWQALGALGERIGVHELVDLAGSLTLVADDGARVRESIAARAGTVRRRQLTAAEGRAGEADQGMLVAQVILAFGFLLLLMYPAAYNVITF